jgi:hypothetical protein
MTAQWQPPGFVQAYKPTPAEKQELADLQDYLNSHARNGTLDRMPEGSINAVLNRASPAVRQHLMASQAIVSNFRASGGREAPFEPKRDIPDLNLPKETRAVLDRADQESVIYGLNERLGTDTGNATLNSGPPDLRETLTACFDVSEGGHCD